MRDRRLHDRVPVAFQVCVTALTNPEISATGEVQEISKAGLGAVLSIPLTPGSTVRIDIADSVLYGFIAHSEEWPNSSNPSFAGNKVAPGSSADTPPERRLFRTGIDVVEVAMGNSGLSQLLKTALEEALPDLEITFSGPA